MYTNENTSISKEIVVVVVVVVVIEFLEFKAKLKPKGGKVFISFKEMKVKSWDTIDVQTNRRPTDPF